MKPSVVFGICIRVLGLCGIIAAIFYIYSGMRLLFGDQDQYYGRYLKDYIILGITLTIIAIYFIRGAPHIVRFAYPEDKEKQDNRDSEPLKE